MTASVPLSKLAQLTNQTTAPFVANGALLDALLNDAGNDIVATQIAIDDAKAIQSALAGPFFPLTIQVPQRVTDALGSFIYSNTFSSYLAQQIGASGVVGVQVLAVYSHYI
jgi:hypothetical protein